MSLRGSEWRKWNFHVHTKGTNKNDQFSSKTMDEFFCAFFKKAYENRISAIAITDYFTVDKYLEAVEFRKNIDSKVDPITQEKYFTDEEISFVNKIFIFPNVELRMLPSTGKARLINIHCLFNPEYISELENDFFSHIQNQENCKMNRHGITNYGRSLDNKLQDSNSQFKKGIENFVIDPKSLKELMDTNIKFKDNTILVVSNSKNDGASFQEHYNLFDNESGSLDGLRKSIYTLCDAIFSGNPKDVKYFLGKRLEGTEGYNDNTYKEEINNVITERGSLKPCLVGCDAHSEQDLFTKFTWVKADLNFEGLRQICFEPEQRVRIQSDEPDFKEGKLIIDKVKFTSPNNIFSTIPIYLNPNLNVIIGGKSSGKSILLYAIAKTLSSDSEIFKNDDGTPKYDLNKIDNNFGFEITTKGNFSQEINRSSEENSIIPGIKYIPQNYLVKLAEPELNGKGKSLYKLVRDLITEDKESNEVYKRFLLNVKQNDKLRNTQIDLFFETKEEIEKLEKELKTKSNKDVLQKNIETNIIKVEELSKNTGLDPEQVEQFKKSNYK